MTETRPDGTVVVTEKIIYTDADGKTTTAINVKQAPVSPPEQSEKESTQTYTPTMCRPLYAYNAYSNIYKNSQTHPVFTLSHTHTHTHTQKKSIQGQILVYVLSNGR